MTMQPNKVTLKAYQVGFGDCFLLTFHYPPTKGGSPLRKDVLIDFGSTGQPKAFGPGLLKRVAEDIQKTTNSRLDIVVATHRHKDHINGFATKKNGKAPGDIIRGCKPKLVLQPWTEDPDAQPDAKKPTQSLSPGAAYLRSLTSMQSFSGSMMGELLSLKGKIGKRLQDQMAFLGEDNLANESAVRNLMTMSSARRYLYFGADARTDEILPGVKVHVLGPPTLEQSGSIRKERSHDAAEFWHLQALTSLAFSDPQKRAFRNTTRLNSLPPYSRWMISRLWRMRGDQLLQLVRILDQAMNNTSLILLFEVGNKAFLFPGDAQIESWSYALSEAKKRPALKKLLQRVDVYKVGHHGSLNATPKSLWKLFAKRNKKQTPTRLSSVLSTLPGKHGSVQRETEVPRRVLVEALKSETDFFTTEELKKKSQIWKEFEFDV